ncbi:MAG: hypothetical protein H0U86_17150 [Chloroflexi bacterium]|nr:hypothetical protein [Chloroflexota bacterium]
MLSDAPHRLIESDGSAGGFECIEFRLHQLGGAEGLVAGVQAHLMTPPVDLHEEIPHGRVGHQVGAVEPGVTCAGHEVERALQVIPFTGFHEQVEGVKGVPVDPTGPSIEE